MEGFSCGRAHDNDESLLTGDIPHNAGNAQEQQWATNLRINLDYHQQLNKQLDASGIAERYQAAKALLFERDCKSQSLLNNLRKGERIHQEHERKKIMKFSSIRFLLSSSSPLDEKKFKTPSLTE
jgi:hypothetical protein